MPPMSNSGAAAQFFCVFPGVIRSESSGVVFCIRNISPGPKQGAGAGPLFVGPGLGQWQLGHRWIGLVMSMFR